MGGDKYEIGEPEQVGKITERPTLPVDKNGKIGWTIYEVTGTDMYRPHEGAAWPPTTIEEARAIAIDENLVTAKDDLKEGDELLVQDLMGLNIAKVAFHSEDGAPYGLSPSGNLMFMFEFVDDRPDGQPPRWVCTGSANLKALKKLKLDW